MEGSYSQEKEQKVFNKYWFTYFTVIISCILYSRHYLGAGTVLVNFIKTLIAHRLFFHWGKLEKQQ